MQSAESRVRDALSFLRVLEAEVPKVLRDANVETSIKDEIRNRLRALVGDPIVSFDLAHLAEHLQPATA